MWQARNLSQHAYCPRLFHFMQVEGAFLPSTDTEQGIAVYRRVDKASQATGPRAEGAGEPEEEAAKPRAGSKTRRGENVPHNSSESATPAARRPRSRQSRA